MPSGFNPILWGGRAPYWALSPPDMRGFHAINPENDALKQKNASKRGVLWHDIFERPPWRNAKSAITPRIMRTQGGFRLTRVAFHAIRA